MSFLVGGEPGYLVPNMYLCIQLLNSALVGLAVMIMTFPLPGYVAKLLQSVQQERMKKVREFLSAVVDVNIGPRPMLVFNLLLRVSNEIYQLAADFICKLAMNVIRMIKLFGWETKMSSLLDEKRTDELKFIRKTRFMELANMNSRYELSC